MSVSSSLIRRSALAALVAATLTLTACAPPVDDASTDAATAEPDTTTSASPSGSAPPDEHREDHGDATAPPKSTTHPDAGEDIGLSCDEVITLQQIYEFNPNVSALGQFTPSAGTAAAKALSYNGLTCRWSNNTSGRSIDVAIAKLASATLDDLAADAAKSADAVTVSGEKGYFATASGVGTVQIFTGSYWVIIASKDFSSARGAEQLASYVLGNLP